ncbi:MAG: hypothetical protein DRJ51_05970 [Thermoprotei archaeon]|nr:MAG: hypothetical protein DRJ51_05970 [Thermoprotei archaeon]RLF02072.1 MAG: hypothetical protein DRJ59_04560 [Thermoprotei archaeon]
MTLNVFLINAYNMREDCIVPKALVRERRGQENRVCYGRGATQIFVKLKKRGEREKKVNLNSSHLYF